jgi:pilus assembly protein CpaB
VSAKTILSLLFLAALGVVAVLGFRALPHRLDGATASARAEMLVAATPLPAGTLLRAKDVAWQPIGDTAEPDRILRPSSGHNPAPAVDQQATAEVYGAALRHAVKAGEPISRAAIVRPGDREFLQVVLSSRARAIAIPVTAGGASTSILSPGDRVDVILTQTFKNDPLLARRSVGETVVEDLRVLAIDPFDTKATTGGSGFGRTVTLEVTPQQAEEINVASELGKLSLTLRSLSANDRIAANATGLTEATRTNPVWAGDVSPALGKMAPPYKAIPAELPQIEVIRGTKVVSVKPQ